MKTETATQLSIAPNIPLLQDILRTAETAARTAGNIQRESFENGGMVEAVNPHDLKMDVDRECEDAIVELIRDHFPGHRILAEEGGDLGGNEEFLWIIDPLDGTVNFFHGLPQFCTCVACCYLPEGTSLPRTGEDLVNSALVGVVYAPVLDEMYVGVSGMGATCNGNPIYCSPHSDLSEVIVALSFGKTEEGIDYMSGLCQILARKARKLRSFGSAGLDISHVASGRFGGNIYRGIHAWDIAAAGLILKEAGGALTAFAQDNGKWNMLASAPGVHEELLQLMSAPCTND